MNRGPVAQPCFSNSDFIALAFCGFIALNCITLEESVRRAFEAEVSCTCGRNTPGDAGADRYRGRGAVTQR